MKFALYNLATLLFVANCSSVFAGNERVMLSWTSYMTHEHGHELYFKDGKVLYIIRYGGGDDNRDAEFPFWRAFNISQEKQGKVTDLLNKIALDSKARGKSKPFCNGFQWGVDIKYGDYDIRYGNRCDSKEIYEEIKKLIDFILGD